MGRDAEAPREQPEREARSTEDRAVVCGACGHALTRESERLEVDGRHQHAFVNPHAYAFTIACYRVAPGCAGSGEASMFWSWFPGHAWRIALCSACGAHVGWSFEREGSAFYGLVVDRIAR